MTWTLQESILNRSHPQYHRIDQAMARLPKYGQGPCLQRMERLCAALDRCPRVDSIKVTGSNGKGSVVAMLGAIFDAMSRDHGCFTSPHLFSYNERFVVNGTMISNSHLEESLAWVEEFISRDAPDPHAYGWFEILTGIAMKHFLSRDIHHWIFEAGIGGRLDPTRFAPGNLVGLTSLDLEHTELLGNTLLDIARDKMDLCPTGGTLVLNRLQAEAPIREIRAYAAQRGINLVEVDQVTQITEWSFQNEGMRVRMRVDDLHFEDLHVALSGYHQIDNACVAILLARHYFKRHWPEFSTEAFKRGVARGLATVHWPGRAEKVWNDPTILVDVGHTPGAAEAFVRGLPQLVEHKPILLVTGISANKQVDGILNVLLPFASEVIPCEAQKNGTPADVIHERVKALAPRLRVHPGAPLNQAMPLAISYAKQRDMAVVVAGGLFLAAESVEWVNAFLRRDR